MDRTCRCHKEFDALFVDIFAVNTQNAYEKNGMNSIFIWCSLVKQWDKYLHVGQSRNCWFIETVDITMYGQCILTDAAYMG